MYNFVFNNLNLIRQFNKLYEKEIDINAIYDYIKNESYKCRVIDFCRFRVFLDLCLLLLNMERVNSIYKGYFTYRSYIRGLIERENDIFTRAMNDSGILHQYNDIKLYYSFLDKELTEWDQIYIIRNSLAHSQFGNFEARSGAGGYLTTFGVFNKDSGQIKNIGIVMESLFHAVVKHFFSNYSYGLLFQYTVFSNYSLKNARNIDGLSFYNITLNNKGKDSIENFEKNVLLKLVRANEQNCLFECIKDNIDYIDVCESRVDNLINIEKLLLNLGYNKNLNDLCFAMKTFLSTNEVLSNFIAHMVHIVDTIYKYKIEEEISDEDLFNSLSSLNEDKYDKLAFDFGFVYLELINLIIRLQDDVYEKINYGNIDVSDFKYNERNVEQYFKRINMLDEINKKEKYVLNRIRNAVMHGNFNLELAEMDYDIVFVDHYNGREETVRVSYANLKKFINQSEFYDKMAKYTNLIICDKK